MSVVGPPLNVAGSGPYYLTTADETGDAVAVASLSPAGPVNPSLSAIYYANVAVYNYSSYLLTISSGQSTAIAEPSTAILLPVPTNGQMSAVPTVVAGLNLVDTLVQTVWFEPGEPTGSFPFALPSPAVPTTVIVSELPGATCFVAKQSLASSGSQGVNWAPTTPNYVSGWGLVILIDNEDDAASASADLFVDDINIDHIDVVLLAGEYANASSFHFLTTPWYFPGAGWVIEPGNANNLMTPGLWLYAWGYT
jgi:hypothetical protein